MGWSVKKPPLYRALRVDKITLTLLFHSLKAWINHQEDITICALLNQTKDALLQKALKLYALLKPLELNVSIASSFSKIGNLSDRELESFCVKIQPKNTRALNNEKLYLKLFQKALSQEFHANLCAWKSLAWMKKILKKSL